MVFTVGLIAGLAFVSIGVIVTLNPEYIFAARHILFVQDVPELNALGRHLYRAVGLAIGGFGLIILWTSLQA